MACPDYRPTADGVRCATGEDRRARRGRHGDYLCVGRRVFSRGARQHQPVAAAVTSLPDVGYLRQLNAEGILAMRPTLVLASAQAQPSLALKQVEQNNVNVVTVPAVTI
ncbi:periplasmic binding protein [Lelliottia amnigena]|nr:periplasmic binding protein [Lelliottia amnigena]